MNPVFYLLAGPNGAGKSTLYRSAVATGLLPAGATFVNADLYEAQALQHVLDPQERSLQARAWADAQRADCLVHGQSFVSETVFSHPSKLELMQQARDAGFAVVLLVVCVNDPRQLLGRVAQRVLLRLSRTSVSVVSSCMLLPEPMQISCRSIAEAAAVRASPAVKVKIFFISKFPKFIFCDAQLDTLFESKITKSGV